jgi:predicted peptidase
VLGVVLALPQVAITQQPPPAGKAPAAKAKQSMPITLEPDPRVQQKSYHFTDTNEEMKYTLYVSSKVKKDTPAPLVVALHGMGGDSNFIVRDRLVDFAEEGGYIVVGPMGYNVVGWYGSPVIVMGGGAVDPPNLRELSEKDVMNVLEIARKEFNVDPNRTYLMGHSMGGAGTIFLAQKYVDQWAAAAAIAPAAFMMQPTQKELLATIGKAGLPLMITQGGEDNVVPTVNTRTWAEAMKELNLPNHRYVEKPDCDHGTIIADSMPDIFAFFAAHTRKR